MRITSKISHYYKGTLALLLAPFLWLQMYFNALQNWLVEILYNELFKLHKNQYSQTTHCLAFVCFSIFSLLAYYKHFEQYISLILYGLWLINYYSAKFRTGLYVDNPAWVNVEIKEHDWQWNLTVKKQRQAQYNFDYHQVHSVLITPITYGDDSFQNQVLQVWHIHLQTKDGEKWVVYQEADIQKALTKAAKLAKQFNTLVKIEDSYGSGNLANFELNVRNQQGVAWQKTFTSSTIKIYKNFSTVSLFRWLRTVFSELGDFIFIAVLAGFMPRYGLLLLLGYGHHLGLTAPTTVQIVSLNPLAIFKPDFDWISVTVFCVTLLALLHSIYKQTRRYEILLNHQRLQYSISGATQTSLNFTQQPDVLLLKGFDKTSLIIVNEQYKVLEIKGLEEDEYTELYEMLLTI